MTADDRLKTALSLGSAEPPAIDLIFAARVAERIERRRFLIRLAVLALWAVAGAVLIWTMRPVLGATLTPVIPLLAPTTALAVMVWVGLRIEPARLIGGLQRRWARRTQSYEDFMRFRASSGRRRSL